MKRVDARLLTGEVIKITEPWFVDVVDRGADWTMSRLVEADFGGSMVARVNPKWIVWARILGGDDK